MTVRFTKRRLILCCILFVVLSLHIASLCVFVRYYASFCVFEFGQGYATLYWGGSAERRNSCIYNAGEWPLNPDTSFGGGYLADGQRWEVYGPGMELRSRWLLERIRIRGVLRAFGYALPQIRREDEAASILVPLGSVAFIVEAGILLLAVNWWRFNKVAGARAPAHL
jgi:hypothetical protein